VATGATAATEPEVKVPAAGAPPVPVGVGHFPVPDAFLQPRSLGRTEPIFFEDLERFEGPLRDPNRSITSMRVGRSELRAIKSRESRTLLTLRELVAARARIIEDLDLRMRQEEYLLLGVEEETGEDEDDDNDNDNGGDEGEEDEEAVADEEMVEEEEVVDDEEVVEVEDDESEDGEVGGGAAV
jgi:hypothetical protein